MRAETRTSYSGATPGADSSTYVIFSTVTAAPMAGWLQLSSLRSVKANFKHTQNFTLNTYKSNDRGVTWLQVSTEAITVTANATTSRSWNVESYRDFKIEVVNGGSAQATWAADVAFYRDKYVRTVAAVAPSITTVQDLLPFSLINADNYVSSAGLVTSFTDLVNPGTGVRALVANHAYIGGTKVAIPTADSGFNGQLTAKFTASQTYASQATATNWTFCHAGTGMTIMALYQLSALPGTEMRMLSTQGNTTAGVKLGIAVTDHAFNVRNATVSIANASYGFGSTTVKVLHEASYQESVAPEYALRAAGVSQASGNTTAAPVVTVSTATTMVLGGNGAGGQNMNAKWAFSVMFNRLISAAERSVIHAYLNGKYGTAFP